MQLPAKEDELKRLLANVPPEKAAALAATVERERLTGPGAMPADMILDALRPSLRRGPKKRIPTPRRLFCVAFEDLLIDGPREEKQTGRIARASIGALWTWLAEEGLRDKLGELERGIAQAILARESKREAELVEQLRSAVADAVRLSFGQVPKDAPARRALALKFGGEDTLADIEEIALVLESAHELAALRAKLPRTIDTLTPDDLSAIRDVYDDLSERRPELCPYVALIVLGRLSKPWEVLRLASVVSRRRDETMFSATDMGVVGDLLLADMEKLADELSAVPAHKMNPATVLPKLERFVAMSNGLIREIRVKRGGKWGQRLVKLRHLCSDAMDALVARAPVEILAVVPVQKFGAFAGRGARRPDLSRAPEPEKIARAVSWASFLADAAPFASDGAFHAAYNEASERVSAHVRQYVDAMVAELRTIEDEMRPRAEAYMEAAGAIGEALFGPEESDLYRRRAAAALASRQPAAM